MSTILSIPILFLVILSSSVSSSVPFYLIILLSYENFYLIFCTAQLRETRRSFIVLHSDNKDLNRNLDVILFPFQLLICHKCFHTEHEYNMVKKRCIFISNKVHFWSFHTDMKSSTSASHFHFIHS